METYIRKYSESDYGGLYELLNTVYGSTIDKETLEHHYLTDQRTIILATNENGQVLGCVFTEIQEDFIRPARVLFITYVAVKECFRKQGIGGLLMKEVEKRSRDAGCTAIELTSADFRKDAHNFYATYGFMKKKTTVFIKETETACH